MKIHVLKSQVVTNLVERICEEQIVIYIPERALVAFRSNRVDYFTDDRKDFSDYSTHAESAEGKPLGDYLGSVNVSDEVIRRIIEEGVSMNRTRESFLKSVRTLADLIK